MPTPYRPVAWYLNALVLACLLPGILGVAFLVLSDYGEEQRRLREANIEAASRLGQAVDEHLLHAGALAQSLAGTAQAGAGSLPALPQEAVRAGSRVVLYKLDGERMFAKSSSGGGWVQATAGAEAARRVLTDGQGAISDVGPDPVSGRPALGIQVPVLREGKVAYALALVLPAAQLSSILLQENYPVGWLLTLLDRHGSIAGRSRDAGKFVGAAPDLDLHAAIVHSDSGALDAVSRDRVLHFMAFWRSPRTGFTTVIGVPKAQLVKPLRNKLIALSAAAAGLFAIGLLLARAMARRIASSIHALVAPATALGEGRQLAVAPVHLSEAARLGDAIERAGGLLLRRDAALRAQKEELQRFAFFSEHSNEMLLLLDQRGAVRYANRMACTRLGYDKDELLSLTLFQVDTRSTPALLEEKFAHFGHRLIPSFERDYRCKDGSEFPVEITATVLEHGGEKLMHVAPRDIGERRRAEQAIRWAATHDALTGLANRARALDFLEQVLARGEAGALLYIDLDRFKPVNDLYGHEVGDRVLQELARRLPGCVGPDDLLARFGGDEFLAVLRAPSEKPGHPEPGLAAAAAIVDALSQPVRLGNIEVALSACVGVSRFPGHGSSAGALVHAADMAMLHAKQGGRDALALYAPAMGTQAQFVLQVERRLQQALDGDGLALHYQPIVDIASGRVEGIEALVRLADGVEPALGPADFIPVAESCGLIAPLGDWVAREACRQQVRWERAGMPLSVAVNVSALQFRRKHFCARIRELIASSGIRPQCLVIELTETALMENLADAVEILRQLKALGVRIALDDFGTGYSSLASLSTLPLDKLKIDQSFVRTLDTDHASRAVIDAVIALANSLGLELVAEGIETEAALDWLRERGCHQGQGYYFSRPLPQDRVQDWIARQHAG
ncbi:bifunctional diguanylate cyclase/phosphodiesterase [Massilia sp. GCM10023247]|uniref:bifunctional diguanylate cyclase/phosphodiesterase n=1 Tax=Massilia sp. GCM10023247 TaxID=3252643 RepID=UPI00362194E2